MPFISVYCIDTSLDIPKYSNLPAAETFSRANFVEIIQLFSPAGRRHDAGRIKGFTECRGTTKNQVPPSQKLTVRHYSHFLLVCLLFTSFYQVKSLLFQRQTGFVDLFLLSTVSATSATRQVVKRCRRSQAWGFLKCFARGKSCILWVSISSLRNEHPRYSFFA